MFELFGFKKFLCFPEDVALFSIFNISVETQQVENYTLTSCKRGG